jgi:hypothetical protein
MGIKITISMVIVVMVSVMSILITLNYGVSLYSGFTVFTALFTAIFTFFNWYKLEKVCKLSENLFYSKFGIKPDKIKLLSGYIYKFDHLKHGIPTNSVRMKFWSHGTIHKGIVDLENEALHMKKPVLIPVYDDTPIPVWKAVTRLYSNGKSKEIEYYDATENLQSVEYLDKDGTLKNRSWRKYKGVELNWNSKKEIWEP